jgi:hypothetical protein
MLTACIGYVRCTGLPFSLCSPSPPPLLDRCNENLLLSETVVLSVISVTGRGGLWSFEMLMISYCLDSRLTDGGKIVSPTHRPRSTAQKHYLFASGTHFC